MMFNHPEVEFDIRQRQRWLTEALAAQSNLSIDLSEMLNREYSDNPVPPPVDQLSWFAMERLAQRTGLTAVRFTQAGQTVGSASLVWVSPEVEPNASDAKAIAQAALVMAGDNWTDLLKQAQAKPRRPSP